MNHEVLRGTDSTTAGEDSPGQGHPQVYDPQKLHAEMGDAFATDIHQPEAAKEAVSEAEYVQL